MGTKLDKRVLVVEDDFLSALAYESMLMELGYAMIGPVATVEDALVLAKGRELFGALLDVNLRGEIITPVADRLKEQGCPFVFLTGYSDLDLLPEAYQGWRFLEKPVTEAELEEELTAMALISR